MLRPLIGEDIVVTTSLDPALGPIEADPGQLHQVVMNLVVNARDAMPAGGALSIETANADLDEHDALDRARPLRHADGARHRRGDRRGDARPHLRALLHHEGRRQGHGPRPRDRLRHRQAERRLRLGRQRGRRRLRVHGLPAARGRAETEPARSRAAAVPEDRGPRPRRCSSSRTRRSCGGSSRRCSRAKASTSLVAQDGDEAIELAGQHHIDLLVTDVVMPKVGGREVSERLRELRPDLKVVFMSGYAEGGIHSEPTLPAQTEFLEKPFTFTELKDKVRGLLDGK